MKPYSLAVRSSVLNATQADIAEISDLAEGWNRTIKFDGGFWTGSFHLSPGALDVQQVFDTWLGYDLQERVGHVTFEAMIYEMTLYWNGSVRRRSLNEMWNATSARYRTTAWIGDNIVGNMSFEDLGGGGVFEIWAEDPDVGNIADGTPTAYDGTHSLLFTSGGTMRADGYSETWVRQNLIVTSGTAYRMSFWTRGVAGAAGRYGVRDPNASEWLVTPRSTGVPGNTWTQVTCEFTGTGEGEVLIFFFPPPNVGEQCYFDYVEVGTAGDATFDTAFLEPLEDSSDRFGRREEILLMDHYPLETAQAELAAFLAQYGWPYARGVSLGNPGENGLDVTVAGYIHTANWLFQMVGTGGDVAISDWIQDIAGADYGLSLNHGGTSATAGDCEFLKAGKIVENTLEAESALSFPVRAWDVLADLASAGIEYPAASGLYRPTQIWVDVGRRLHYDVLDTEPRYYWAAGQLRHRNGTAVTNPYDVRPGVVRDVDYPGRRTDPGSLLDDPRDMLIVEVEVDQHGRLILKPEDYDETEGVLARADLAAQLEASAGS